MESSDSKKKIQEAFLDLLSKQHIEKITISAIIQKAGVSRTTYYRYYYEQREILEEIVADFIAKMEESSSKIGVPDIFPENNLQYTLSVYMELQCYYENAELLRRLYKSDASEYLREQLYQHFSHSYNQWMSAADEIEGRELYVTQEDSEFHKHYSFAGHYDIIRGWILGGCKTPIDNLVRFIMKASSVNRAFISVK